MTETELQVVKYVNFYKVCCINITSDKVCILTDKTVTHGDNRFKRFVDSTLTVEIWENLYKWSQSVGFLYSPLQISTVFRVGTTSVLSVAHHVFEITGGWYLYEKKY